MAASIKVLTTHNPLRCGGGEIPLDLTLVAKLLALFVLTRLLWMTLPDPFLPFFPILDHFRNTPLWWILRIVVLLGSIAIVFNYRTRTACAIVGLGLLLGILGSRPYFENNRLYLACLFITLSLYERNAGPWLVRAQVILVFFAAALNKLLDPAWRNGDFFAYWGGQLFIQPWYFRLNGCFSNPKTLPIMMSWLVIVAEFNIAAGLLYRRSRSWAIWIGLVFFAGLDLLTGQTFGFFYFAPISFLAFAGWPHSTATVLYDGDCGFCNQTRRFMERLDLEGLFAWSPFQSAKNLYGIAEEELQKRLYVIIGERQYSGFGAFKIMFLYNPLTYFVLFLAFSPPHYQRYWLTIPLLLFFSPLVSPVGEMAYHLVARNRLRISRITVGEGASCGITTEVTRHRSE